MPPQNIADCHFFLLSLISWAALGCIYEMGFFSWFGGGFFCSFVIFFSYLNFSVFYSGLVDLVHVKMSNTTALSSSSPHSSVCPSVFSDVSQCWLANLLLHPWNAALVPQDPLGLRGVCRVVPSACQSREALTGALGRGCSRPQPPHTAHSARGSHKPSLNPSHHKAQSGKTVPGRLLPVLSQPMDWIP